MSKEYWKEKNPGNSMINGMLIRYGEEKRHEEMHILVKHIWKKKEILEVENRHNCTNT